MNSETQYTGARFTTFPMMSRRQPAIPLRAYECSLMRSLTLFPNHEACAATASFVGNSASVSAV